MLPDSNRKCIDIHYKSFGKGLVMASLNINSLLAHIDEFRVFMNVNLMPGVISVNATVNDIFEIFGLQQLLVDPTRSMFLCTD